MDKKQDNYELKVDSKYGKYMKLLIAALTALGLIGSIITINEVVQVQKC
jgi:hypothetical protein